MRRLVVSPLVLRLAVQGTFPGRRAGLRLVGFNVLAEMAFDPRSSRNHRIVAHTTSGANGREATTAQGEIVPSSSQNGTPRAM